MARNKHISQSILLIKELKSGNKQLISQIQSFRNQLKSLKDSGVDEIEYYDLTNNFDDLISSFLLKQQLYNQLIYTGFSLYLDEINITELVGTDSET